LEDEEFEMAAKQYFEITTNASGAGGQVGPNSVGRLVQFCTLLADTGIRADTGLVITVKADTGRLNKTLLVAHNLPNAAPNVLNLERLIKSTDSGWDITDTGGHPFYAAGERMRVDVQGISTDTGKLVRVYLYFDEGPKG
jgi:hypothetical protein